jgi:hypothetical protein
MHPKGIKSFSPFFTALEPCSYDAHRCSKRQGHGSYVECRGVKDRPPEMEASEICHTVLGKPFLRFIELLYDPFQRRLFGDQEFVYGFNSRS